MFDKGIKIYIVVACFICAITSGVFALTQTPLNSLVWVFFLGFTISSATPHQIKEIPNLFFSQMAGWGWAILMNLMCVYIIQFSGSLALALFLAIFIGGSIMLAVHFKFLMNTWLNNISMLFAALIAFFGTQNFSIIIYVMTALTAGSVFCALVDPICGLFMKTEQIKATNED